MSPGQPQESLAKLRLERFAEVYLMDSRLQALEAAASLPQTAAPEEAADPHESPRN
ncbi:MAG: hypothetical protein ICV62_01285 [Cyanobacteria bacterium Co-bin13]|nr:hypothetical protein [Cyanobacteria bacterium Co-bin13]